MRKVVLVDIKTAAHVVYRVYGGKVLVEEVLYLGIRPFAFEYLVGLTGSEPKHERYQYG